MYLCIQYTVIQYYLYRVPPFGNLRLSAYLRLIVAYRSLSRPSSTPDAKAFPLCSYQLDLIENICVVFSFDLLNPLKLYSLPFFD